MWRLRFREQRGKRRRFACSSVARTDQRWRGGRTMSSQRASHCATSAMSRASRVRGPHGSREHRLSAASTACRTGHPKRTERLLAVSASGGGERLGGPCRRLAAAACRALHQPRIVFSTTTARPQSHAANSGTDLRSRGGGHYRLDHDALHGRSRVLRPNLDHGCRQDRCNGNPVRPQAQFGTESIDELFVKLARPDAAHGAGASKP